MATAAWTTGKHWAALAVALAGFLVASVNAQTPPVALPSTDALLAAKAFHPKIHGPLRARLPASPDALPTTTALALDVVDANDRTAVRIGTDDPAAVAELLTSIGRPTLNRSSGSVETYLSADELLLVESDDRIINIRAIVPMMPRLVTQGRALHNANQWIAGGYSGSGVRIGIIDTFGGLRSQLGRELPASVVARCYSDIGTFSPNLADCERGNAHGTAVAETIADLAPAAQLFVANPISPGDLHQTVGWMIANGVRIINLSATYPWDGPGNGTSPEPDSPLRAVDDAVAGGALFVAAAGNEASATWLGPWRDNDADNILQYTGTTSAESNLVSVGAGERLIVQLRWSDSWTAAASDIDLWLYNGSGGLVASSTLRQAGQSGERPFETLTMVAPAAGTYQIQITRASGAVPGWLQLQAFTSHTLQYASAGSIGSPAESANPGLLAVGAARWNTPTVIEPYSSQGPTPDGRVKPDIVAADGGDTASYGAFLGTSQASPHVAGLAALARQRFPLYSAAQIANFLKTNAQPRGVVPNNTWGWGFARLPELGGSAAAPTDLAATVTGSLVSLTWRPPSGRTVTDYWLEAGTESGLANIVSTQVGTVTRLDVSAPNGRYYVRVRALVDGVWSDPSNEIRVDVGIEAPSAPIDFRVLVDGTRASLSWLAGSGATPSSYVIEAGSASGAANLAVVPVVGTSLIVPNVPSGHYYARVRASSGGVSGPPSNEVQFDISPPQPPGTPRLLTGNVSGQAVTLQWQPAASGGTPDAYLIVAGSQSGWADLAVIPIGTSLSASAPAVAPGTYHVRIIAMNGSGQSSSNEIVLQVPQ